jgi:hypothetical protein
LTPLHCDVAGPRSEVSRDTLHVRAVRGAPCPPFRRRRAPDPARDHRHRSFRFGLGAWNAPGDAPLGTLGHFAAGAVDAEPTLIATGDLREYADAADFGPRPRCLSLGSVGRTAMSTLAMASVQPTRSVRGPLEGPRTGRWTDHRRRTPQALAREAIHLGRDFATILAGTKKFTPAAPRRWSVSSTPTTGSARGRRSPQPARGARSRWRSARRAGGARWSWWASRRWTRRGG